MNQERVRERRGEYQTHGTDKKAPGQHSHLRGIAIAVNKIREHFQGEPAVGGFHPEDHIPLDQEIVLFPQVTPKEVQGPFS